MSWESMLPMGIISAMIFVMANSQDVINKLTTGKVSVCCSLSLSLSLPNLFPWLPLFPSFETDHHLNLHSEA
jgi:hypothetical protein